MCTLCMYVCICTGFASFASSLGAVVCIYICARARVREKPVSLLTASDTECVRVLGKYVCIFAYTQEKMQSVHISAQKHTYINMCTCMHAA